MIQRFMLIAASPCILSAGLRRAQYSASAASAARGESTCVTCLLRSELMIVGPPRWT